ncbi:MAG: alpha/beta hydrolase [Nitrospira sp.]|nr:alpha/beta hydrolase [Nitrospira sp.]
MTTYNITTVDDLNIFYREAGSRANPTILLLHGFPSSSFMYRNLIDALADKFHLVAPDYPGFGYSSFPDAKQFSYTFANYANVVDTFTRAVGLENYILYLQDYGAPIGFRLALLGPERVTALIVQNGNAYEEGLSSEWEPIKTYWREPTSVNRAKLRDWLNSDGIRLQYVAGVPDTQITMFSPDTWTLDWEFLARPGNIEVQLDLFGDYKTNIAMYSQFQAFFRAHRPPTLIVWGKYDPFFMVLGAEAYRRDLPSAELHVLDAGHFALETHASQIAGLIREFLKTKVFGGSVLCNA